MVETVTTLSQAKRKLSSEHSAERKEPVPVVAPLDPVEMVRSFGLASLVADRRKITPNAQRTARMPVIGAAHAVRHRRFADSARRIDAHPVISVNGKGSIPFGEKFSTGNGFYE